MGYFTNDINAGGGGGVTDHGALTGLGDDDHTQYSLLSSGSGAPGTTPSRVGEIYVDTTADVAYISTGTASSADWTLTNDGAGDMLLAGTQTNTGAKTFNSGTLKTAGSTSGTTTVNASAVAGTTTLTLPAATDTLVGKATSDTLTNKTINTASNTITVVEADISDLGSYITAPSTDTLTNKTFDANATGNSLSNVDVVDLANGTDGELITWDAAGAPTTVAVGTSGQVLTSNGTGAAPTFQDAAGGGGGTWTVLATASASASSTVDFDNYLDSTYDYYVLIGTNIVPSFNGGRVMIRLGTGATPTYASGSTDYFWACSHVGFDLSSADTVVVAGDDAEEDDSLIEIIWDNGSMSSTAANAWNLELRVFNPSSTTVHTHVHGSMGGYDMNGDSVLNTFHGGYKSTTAVTSVRVLPQLTTIKTGDFVLYGVANS